MVSSYSIPKLKYFIYVFLLVFIVSFNNYGQNMIGVVDYMKVENPDEYLEIENQWQKIHRERLKEGMIIGWAVYQIMFKTTEDPYNFVTISWYDAFSKLDKKVPQSIMEAAYPDKNKDDWKVFNQQTNNCRKLIASGVFHQQLSTSADLSSVANYYVVNEINVKPGRSKEFLKIKEEIYLPVYLEDKKNNNRMGWSLWAKWPGDMKDFQYVSADGYKNLEQINQVDYLSYFSKIHPDINTDSISNRVEQLRTLVNTEMWKMIYCVLP